MMTPQQYVQGERHDARFAWDSRSHVAADRRSAINGAGISEPASARGSRVSARRPYRRHRAPRGANTFRPSRPAVLCREHRWRGRQHRGRSGRGVYPDGYTIMAISTGFLVNPSLYAKVPYDPIKDFSAVTLVAVSPNVVVVNPSVAAKTLPELVQLIRDNPGKYSYAGPGVGSTPHLGGELFRLTSQLDLVPAHST